jgi:predicted ArsR family transcriptional regulator
VLVSQGYEPLEEDGDLALANCPFDSLARKHTDLICGVNCSFVQGVADGMGAEDLSARLAPAEGRCCVRVSGG